MRKSRRRNRQRNKRTIKQTLPHPPGYNIWEGFYLNTFDHNPEIIVSSDNPQNKINYEHFLNSFGTSLNQ